MGCHPERTGQAQQEGAREPHEVQGKVLQLSERPPAVKEGDKGSAPCINQLLRCRLKKKLN